MYQTYTTTPMNSTIRRFLDRNTLALWATGIAFLFSTMALPAFV